MLDKCTEWFYSTARYNAINVNFLLTVSGKLTQLITRMSNKALEINNIKFHLHVQGV